MKCLLVAAMLTVCTLRVLALDQVSTTSRDFPQCRVYPGVLDEDNQPVSGARLCATEGKTRCFTLAHSGKDSDKDNWFYYGLRVKSQRLKLNGGGALVLFNANCCGGSGSSDRYVLLRSEPDRSFKNLLPETIVTNQADVAAWDLPAVSPMPVFLTADYLWGAMEAHYSAHFFEVRMYVYDPVADSYKLRHKYRTDHKYPGIDNWEQAAEVLEKERGRIIQLLRTK
jgi:hypothetical protein